jgi:putative FmdB family regulatory protein
MPIFEFVCNKCKKTFEDLVLSASRTDEVVCPSCGSGDVKKKMSTFSSKVTSGGNSFSFNTSSSSACSTGSV